MKLKDVKPIHIQEIVNHLIDSGYSHSTIEKVKNILKPAFNVAVINKFIPETPFVGIQLPEKTEKKVRAFTRVEQREFEKAAVKSYFYEFFITGLNTGARCGELLSLSWNDIDFKKNILKISKTLILEDIDNKQVLKVQNVPKTKSSNRPVPIPLKCVKLLQNLKERRMHNNLNDNNIVFCSKVGTYAYPKNVRRSMHSVCKNANIEYASIHVLRHTYATRLFEEKVDIKKVSSLLGHSKIDLTYNQYVHVFTEDENEAAEILNNLIL